MRHPFETRSQKTHTTCCPLAPCAWVPYLFPRPAPVSYIRHTVRCTHAAPSPHCQNLHMFAICRLAVVPYFHLRCHFVGVSWRQILAISQALYHLRIPLSSPYLRATLKMDRRRLIFTCPRPNHPFLVSGLSGSSAPPPRPGAAPQPHHSVSPRRLRTSAPPSKWTGRDCNYASQRARPISSQVDIIIIQGKQISCIINHKNKPRHNPNSASKPWHFVCLMSRSWRADSSCVPAYRGFKQRCYGVNVPSVPAGMRAYSCMRAYVVIRTNAGLPHVYLIIRACEQHACETLPKLEHFTITCMRHGSSNTTG